ncbi:ammonium transporter [Spirosomataceae bacterium TFI 002]|nr:ammonium transporter [Spirosomataceae bacterium TFI 002]
MDGLFTANNVWMMICTALVFFMHTGFAFLEIGLTRQKNTINILFKNVFIICIGLLLYALCGFNLMYPGDFNGFVGFAGFGLTLPENGLTAEYASGGYTYWTDFLFQGMFAATAATIVSGAVAERIKLSAFMIFTVIYVGLVYPIAGSWKWGGGFLDEMGFYDFAGSTLVHGVGGWAALVAVWLLGPRIDKFDKNGKSKAIPGHNIPLAAAGVLILWLGWFGFNGGSVLSADPALTSLTLVTTCLAAAAGGVFAFTFDFLVYKKYDLTMMLNGILAGLVGITAGADQMGVLDAILIGGIAGVIVVLSVGLIDKVKLDDPVGAVAVHLICGIWGTLAVGIFGAMASVDQFLTQLIGIACYGVFCVATSFLIIFTLKKTMGIRVSKEEEVDGLDDHEHGMSAYGDFSIR